MAAEQRWPGLACHTLVARPRGDRAVGLYRLWPFPQAQTPGCQMADRPYLNLPGVLRSEHNVRTSTRREIVSPAKCHVSRHVDRVLVCRMLFRQPDRQIVVSNDVSKGEKVGVEVIQVLLFVGLEPIPITDKKQSPRLVVARNVPSRLLDRCSHRLSVRACLQT